VANRLALAQFRLEAAEQERIWAIASAHSQGLSIRKIATVTALSSSRVHQLLHADEAGQIPEWPTSLNEAKHPIDAPSGDDNSQTLSALQRQLSDEGGICITPRKGIIQNETIKT
jgi:hypothetical protein